MLQRLLNDGPAKTAAIDEEIASNHLVIFRGQMHHIARVIDLHMAHRAFQMRNTKRTHCMFAQGAPDKSGVKMIAIADGIGKVGRGDRCALFGC